MHTRLRAFEILTNVRPRRESPLGAHCSFIPLRFPPPPRSPERKTRFRLRGRAPRRPPPPTRSALARPSSRPADRVVAMGSRRPVAVLLVLLALLSSASAKFHAPRRRRLVSASQVSAARADVERSERLMASCDKRWFDTNLDHFAFVRGGPGVARRCGRRPHAPRHAPRVCARSGATARRVVCGGKGGAGKGPEGEGGGGGRSRVERPPRGLRHAAGRPRPGAGPALAPGASAALTPHSSRGVSGASLRLVERLGDPTPTARLLAHFPSPPSCHRPRSPRFAHRSLAPDHPLSSPAPLRLGSSLFPLFHPPSPPTPSLPPSQLPSFSSLPTHPPSRSRRTRARFLCGTTIATSTTCQAARSSSTLATRPT